MIDYDLVGRLRELEATKPGEMGPQWLRPIDCSWAVPVSALAGAAADEIERLRNQLGAAHHYKRAISPLVLQTEVTDD